MVQHLTHVTWSAHLPRQSMTTITIQTNAIANQSLGIKLHVYSNGLCGQVGYVLSGHLNHGRNGDRYAHYIKKKINQAFRWLIHSRYMQL